MRNSASTFYQQLPGIFAVVFALAICVPTPFARAQAAASEGDSDYWVRVLDEATPASTASNLATLHGWDGDVLVPAVGKPPFDELSHVRAERQGSVYYAIHLSDPNDPSTLATLQGFRGRANFDESERTWFNKADAGFPPSICDGVAYPDNPPPFHRCVSQSSPAMLFTRENLNVQYADIGDAPTLHWAAHWYDPDRDMSYDLELSDSGADWFDSTVDGTQVASTVADWIDHLVAVHIAGDAQANVPQPGIVAAPPSANTAQTTDERSFETFSRLIQTAVANHDVTALTTRLHSGGAIGVNCYLDGCQPTSDSTVVKRFQDFFSSTPRMAGTTGGTPAFTRGIVFKGTPSQPYSPFGYWLLGARVDAKQGGAWRIVWLSESQADLRTGTAYDGVEGRLVPIEIQWMAP